jgi:hypothetical protein
LTDPGRVGSADAAPPHFIESGPFGGRFFEAGVVLQLREPDVVATPAA